MPSNENKINWAKANFRLRMREMPRPLEPKVDEVVSKIVGKKIFTHDPRLISLIIKWKKRKGDDDSPDNYFTDPKKVAELKQVLGGNL
jgi:hypothetical protein